MEPKVLEQYYTVSGRKCKSKCDIDPETLKDKCKIDDDDNFEECVKLASINTIRD